MPRNAASAVRVAALAVVILTFVAGPASAGTFTLSTVAQLGGTHAWNNPLTWLEGGLPTSAYPGQNAGDVVTFGGPSNLTVRVGTNVPNAVTLALDTATLEIDSGGVLRLTGASGVTSAGLLKISGGVLDNAGTLDFAGGTAFDWADGIIQGSGTTKLNIFTTTGARMQIEGAAGATLDAQKIELNGGELYYDNGGSLALLNGGSIMVNDGFIEAQSAGTWSSDGSGIVKIAGGTSLTTTLSMTGTFRVEAQLFNDGTIDVTTGTVELAGGGLHTGTFTSTGAGASLTFAGGTHTLNNATADGAGYTMVLGGTVTLAGANSFTTTRTRFGGGTVNGAGTLGITSIFEWTGGTIAGPGGAITLASGGEFNGIQGAMNLNGRQLIAGDDVTYTPNNSLTLQNNGELTINNGAALIFTGDDGLFSDGTGLITNNGAIRKEDTGVIARPRPPIATNPAIPAAAEIHARVVSNGGAVIETTFGILRLLGGGTNAGTTLTSEASGDLLEFAGGTHVISSGSFLSGIGAFGLRAGTLQVDMPITIPASGAFAHLGGTLSGSATVTNQGVYEWRGGDMSGSGTTVNAGILNIDGSDAVMRLAGTRTLDNNLTLNYSATAHILEINDSAVLQNDGTMNLTVDSTIGTSAGGSRRIVNNNQIVRNGGGGMFEIRVPLDLALIGRVQIATGYIALQAGGSSSGTSVGFDVTHATGLLKFTGGTYNLNSGTTITMTPGAVFYVNAATVNMNVPLTLANVQFHDGTLGGSANLTIAPTVGTMTWLLGTMNGSGETIISAGATLTATANASRSVDTRLIRNHGLFSLNPTTHLTLRNGGRIVNEASGIVDLNGDGAIAVGTGGGSVLNNGTLKKSGGSANMGTRIDAPVTNAGTLSSQLANASLILAGGGTSTGTLDTSTSSASIDVFAQTFTITSGNITGGGITRVNGTGTLTAATNLTFAQLEVQPGGTLDGSGNLTVSSAGRWSGGTIRGTTGTTLSVPNTATFAISDAQPHTLDRRAITNAGSLLLAGPSVALSLENGAAITNNNQMEAQSSSSVQTSTSGSIANGGTLRKTGSGSAAFSVPFTNSGNVKSEAGDASFSAFSQSAGTLRLAGGGITAVNPLNLNGGTLDGSGTITGSVSNNGATVSPGTSPGAILLTGSYAQGATGTLRIELAGTPPALYDQFSVNGSVLLGGTLDVLLLSPFTPANGDTFDILPFDGTRTGNFTTVTLPTFGVDGTFAANYVVSPQTLRLTASVTASANLAITKTGPANVAAGSPITWTITVTNNGPDTAGSVTVNDVTPAGLTFAGNSGACSTPFPCNVGAIPSGQSKSISATYSVPLTDPAGTTYTNIATVTTTDNDPDLSNNSATATATVVAASADVAIAMNGPATVTPGSTFAWTLTIRNYGPDSATNVVINDPTPAGLTFVGNAGACTTPFPCSLGTMPSGQLVTITATYSVPAIATAGTTYTNVATATSSIADGDSTNNSATAVATVTAPSANLTIAKSGPPTASFGETITYTIEVRNDGPSPADAVMVDDATPARLTFDGSSDACTTPFPCSLGTLAAGETRTIFATYRVTSAGTETIVNTASVSSTTPDPDASNNSATVTTAPGCDLAPPQLQAPVGSVSASPVTFSWTAINGALSYHLEAFSGTTRIVDVNTGTTSSQQTIAGGGTISWYVTAILDNCVVRSATATFTLCNPPLVVIPSVVGLAASGQTYAVEWDATPGIRYELDEATNANFTDVITHQVPGGSKSFTKTADGEPLAFFYRVRAFSTCSPGASGNSVAVRVVITPLVREQSPNASVPAGSDRIIVQRLFVPGEPNQTLAFTAAVDRPWLDVSPLSGILPPDGVTLEVSADPAGLTNGTFSGSVIVTINPASNAIGTNASTSKTSTVSISLVTPVKPVLSKGTPPDSALIVPSVGHLDGVNSKWQSDVRVTNTSSQARKYLLTFTPANTAQGVKQTLVNVDAGATMALDDVVRNWYGIGALGDSANGVLEIRPETEARPGEPSVALTTVASSRTYNVTANGTLGQYIPALPFSGFIGKAAEGSFAQILGIQQIAQSSKFRTNLGLVEAAGQPASLMVSVFNAGGQRLLQLPVNLAANQQMQINAFLAQHDIAIEDGRLEVQVVGGNGRVSAYASVVDNLTNDPLLVSGVPLGAGAVANRWVLPGVADLDNGLASWRTDMRIFNDGLASQNATLTFFPQGGGSAIAREVTIDPGQVRTLDNALEALFGVKETGGAMHVATATDASLVVTGRTYNQTDAGTYGQFIPAVTAQEAVGVGGRTLNVLQVEDSARYRTNLGLAEVTGKGATVEVTVVLPDSRISPIVRIPLQANEFRQYRILEELGFGNIYNARLAVRVVEGEGKITAYGSVIDMQTQDPTYVPAQ